MQRGPRCARNDLCLPCGFAHDSARSAPAAEAEAGERETHLAIALENPKPRPVLPLPCRSEVKISAHACSERPNSIRSLLSGKFAGSYCAPKKPAPSATYPIASSAPACKRAPQSIGMAGRGRGASAHQAFQQVYCPSNQGCELERAPPLCQRWEAPPAIRCCPPSEWLRWFARAGPRRSLFGRVSMFLQRSPQSADLNKKTAAFESR